MIELTQVIKRYASQEKDGAQVDALRGIDLTIRPGELVAIVGRSGSGKSTLLNIMGALDHATGGEVRLCGHTIESMTDAQLTQLRQQKIGFVFQFFHLLPTLTAIENAVLPLLLGGAKMRDVYPKAEAQLSQLGLLQRIHHLPSQMSGGEMQRVAIARALLNAPEIVLADEPTGNLDSSTGDQVLELLLSVANDNRAVVIVTHDMRIASRANRVITIRDGLIESDTKNI